MVCLCVGVQTWGKKGLAEDSYAWQEGHVNSHGRLEGWRVAERRIGKWGAKVVVVVRKGEKVGLASVEGRDG